MAYEYFNTVARFFKNSNLAEYPLSVRRIKLAEDLQGFCQLRGKKFIIKINRDLPEDYSIEVLLHEVAHAMSWEQEKDVHGIKWGKAYSKVYRLFLERFIEE